MHIFQVRVLEKRRSGAVQTFEWRYPHSLPWVFDFSLDEDQIFKGWPQGPVPMAFMWHVPCTTAKTTDWE